ncbi:hypothetical protein JTB14_019928 [Gonioctena quinquepunctata]|nr:hypothetical protein JTB14_019928 [Gonioctena quinquepunctata]
MQFLNILEQLGLANYSQNVINEGITDESFCLLDDSTIHLLIDKAGPRLIFQRKYAEYKSNTKLNSSGSILNFNLLCR